MLIGIRDKSPVLSSKSWTQLSQRAFLSSRESSLMMARAPGIWKRSAGLTASLARSAGSSASLTVSQLARRLCCAVAPEYVSPRWDSDAVEPHATLDLVLGRLSH